MSAEGIDNGLTAAAREIDLDLDGETFAGNEDGGEMGVFFQDAESAKIFVFVEMVAFHETVFGKGIVDFARRAGGADEDSDNTNDDKDDESPPLEKN